MPPGPIAVCLEVLPKSTVAFALDWPGWCRAGRDEAGALEALAGYADRYAPVAEKAGRPLPSEIAFDVVSRVPGGSPTAFAAPECRRPFPQTTIEVDGTKPTPTATRRLVDLLAAGWATFDEIAAASPAELRKGPRGGGRDRDELIGHVLVAEKTYARKLGVKLKQPAGDDRAAIQDLRQAITTAIDSSTTGDPVVPNGWTARYAARRIAWHVLEHAWEMQDRTPAR